MNSKYINIFYKIKLIYISIVLFLLYSFIEFEKKEPTLSQPHVDNSPQKTENYISSLDMYLSVRKWCEYYQVPEYLAFNIAFKETGYRGPLHLGYNPNLTSSSGAKGAMQILPSTANWVQKNKVPTNILSESVDLNVQISIKYLKYLRKKFGSWPVALGVYNTGHPVVNEYASYCYNNKNYKNKWFKAI